MFRVQVPDGTVCHRYFFPFFLPPVYAYAAPGMHLPYLMGKLVYLYQSSSEFGSSIPILNVVRDLGVQIHPDAEA